jgi:GNAT superfamily N-acetyltransferase
MKSGNNAETAYELSGDLKRIDFERVHGWLTGSYWSPGIALEKVKRAAAGSSLVIGIYLRETGEQVAYGRVVSDRATFAWIADIYVDPAHRGRGLAKRIIRFALEHPQHQDLRRWVLATKDAHEVYTACGFEPLPMPERWMVHLPAKKG